MTPLLTGACVTHDVRVITKSFSNALLIMDPQCSTHRHPKPGSYNVALTMNCFKFIKYPKAVEKTCHMPANISTSEPKTH